MTEWILLIFILYGLAGIILTLQVKDYRYPSQIYEEVIKEFRCDDE